MIQLIVALSRNLGFVLTSKVIIMLTADVGKVINYQPLTSALIVEVFKVLNIITHC